MTVNHNSSTKSCTFLLVECIVANRVPHRSFNHSPKSWHHFDFNTFESPGHRAFIPKICEHNQTYVNDLFRILFCKKKKILFMGVISAHLKKNMSLLFLILPHLFLTSICFLSMAFPINYGFSIYVSFFLIFFFLFAMETNFSWPLIF